MRRLPATFLASMFLPALTPAALLAQAVPPPVSTPANPSAIDEAGGLPAGYVLSWSDEFAKPGLPDSANWMYDTDRNRDGWWNDEKQYYAAGRLANSSVADGLLTITARREDSARLPDSGGQAYTSARLLTRGRHEFTYGFVEVRAKLPCGRGSWPAIWMLGTTGGWPDGGEIDIMEHVGHEPNVIHATVHSAGYNAARGNMRHASVKLADVCGSFHRYQLDWTKDRIRIGVDDRYHYAYDRDATPGAWPFDKPQYLILNVAVGGSWGGAQGIDDSAFPQAMQVDYVRIYRNRRP